MSYEKMTKAELIEKLQQSISMEKYNKLEKKLEFKNNYIEELEKRVHTHEKRIEQVETKHKNFETSVNTQFARAKEDYEYLEGLVSSEFELVNLVYNKSKHDAEFGDKLFNLYHNTLFKENNK